MRVLCAICAWEETHENILSGLLAQKKHLLEAHGISPEKRKKQKWRNPPGDPTVIGHVPGVSRKKKTP